uniref:Uncharacterized protein n=1 Tax=Garrulus glandarius parvoviridae sp. TaxID=2794508 RepID=A0A8A4XE86_9VIRU|nr:MAG: hypothetical protein [Garrulus glandarius parvoviridae sp.]
MNVESDTEDVQEVTSEQEEVSDSDEDIQPTQEDPTEIPLNTLFREIENIQTDKEVQIWKTPQTFENFLRAQEKGKRDKWPLTYKGDPEKNVRSLYSYLKALNALQENNSWISLQTVLEEQKYCTTLFPLLISQEIMEMREEKILKKSVIESLTKSSTSSKEKNQKVCRRLEF